MFVAVVLARKAQDACGIEALPENVCDAYLLAVLFGRSD